jgi:hypothetical protein
MFDNFPIQTRPTSSQKMQFRGLFMLFAAFSIFLLGMRQITDALLMLRKLPPFVERGGGRQHGALGAIALRAAIAGAGPVSIKESCMPRNAKHWPINVWGCRHFDRMIIWSLQLVVYENS